MRGVTTLSLEPSIKVISAISINLILAVGLVVILALTAVLARPNLRTSTNTITDLGEGDLVAYTKDLADDLVADSERVGAVTPVAADGVTVTGADTAAFDLDVDIVLAKGTRLEGVLLEVGPVLGAGGLEALELVGDRHDEYVWGIENMGEGRERKKETRVNGKIGTSSIFINFSSS